MKDQILWTSDIDVHDWAEEWLSTHSEELEDELGYVPSVEAAIKDYEYQIYCWASDINNWDLDDIRHELSSITGDLWMFGTVGRWNGRFFGALHYDKLTDFLHSFSTSDNILELCVSENDLYHTEHHHDSTNYFVIRRFDPAKYDEEAHGMPFQEFVEELIFNENLTNEEKYDKMTEFTAPVGPEIEQIRGGLSYDL